MTSQLFKGARIVRSSWLDEDGRRLDCNPYMSGALEARATLNHLKVKKQSLNKLTLGYAGGIYNGPMFKRNFVDSPEYGVPFISSGTMLLADLSKLQLLRKKDAFSNRLSYLQLHAGMTLISCSGTIGKMSYVRPDMEDVWSSQDVLKVVPDRSQIPPGYVYAYLSSKYGLPLVVSGTYGAIIQHLEPVHIAELPVPRFENEFEAQISSLVEAAAVKRSIAIDKRREALALFERVIEWNPSHSRPVSAAVLSGMTVRRMDAYYHSSFVRSGVDALSHRSSVRLSEMVDSVYEPNRGPRLKVTDSDYGVPFLSSSSVFELNPVGEYLISRARTPNFEQLILTKHDLLIPRSGQIGGVIGRAVLPLHRNVGNAASEHLIRVRCHSEADAAYLWAVFASQPGYRAVVGTAFGSSIPSLDASLIGEIFVPWLDSECRQRISDLVTAAQSAQGEGVELELSAIALLEQKIAKGG